MLVKYNNHSCCIFSYRLMLGILTYCAKNRTISLAWLRMFIEKSRQLSRAGDNSSVSLCVYLRLLSGCPTITYYLLTTNTRNLWPRSLSTSNLSIYRLSQTELDRGKVKKKSGLLVVDYISQGISVESFQFVHCVRVCTLIKWIRHTSLYIVKAKVLEITEET